MSVPRARLMELAKAQCQVFATTFNPKGVRQGGKVLRQRLKGPALAAYYPPRSSVRRDLKLHPLVGSLDEKELDRLVHIQELKERGKSAPKKKKEASEPKAGKKKR